ncbi:hypothetical protein I302_101573 [Kwoniella bestiolae CBS 10118]|uniref:Uncharacterized protein n=1 Tax=Kwoniella bestiolae CBS 10118 TaxID=1296100 RepID=A0A1B9GCP1_9TREE|nr:hypothetical protein I302_00256 [Kwoniella bestiolae CBS 10118]OCF28767.1 hypothetical protein I302_00256 [Kwoniella bestiolae CBS 10118]
MVQIKSSVLVAAAAISAASALPTSSSQQNNLVDLVVGSAANGGSPTKAVSTNDFRGNEQEVKDAVIDLDADLGRVQPLLQARRERKGDDEDGGLKRSVKDMVKNVEEKAKSGGGRMWKGKPSKRGPWRNGGDLIDLNIGHGAVDVNTDHGRPLVNGNLLDLAIRSPHHDDRVILTGDDHEYYRNSGHRGHHHGNVNVHEHTHLHARHHGHGRHRHSVVEVIGDGYRGHHRGGYEFIDTGRHGYRNGDVDVHEHTHIHDRSHHDDVVVVDGGRHRHVDGVVVVDGGRHRHGDDVTVVNNGHRHGDTTVVNNDGHHRHGDTTIVNNGHHRGDTTVVNNHKRSPKLGFSSKLAGLGRAFLKRSHSDDRHWRHDDDTTIVNNGRHGDTTIIDGERHHDTTLINNGRHGETTLINGGRHDDTLIVDNDRHRHNGDTTIVNNDRHHDTTVVNNGRHGDTTVVNNGGYRHHGNTTVVNNHKRGHHHDDRIIVVGDQRRYRDADFYYRNSWDNGLSYGKPIYFSDGGSFNRVRMIDNYGYRHGSPRGGFVGVGGGMTVIPADAIPLRGGRYNDYPYGYGYHYGRYGKREGDEKRHHHDEHDDITVINNDNHHGHHGHHDEDVTVVNNHKRHHGHDDDRHCRHGRCDGDDVTIVNNHKRQMMQDNGMGGAPGYIDVTSPVFNSTTATRIASLVLSTSNGTDANSTFVLNASSNIRTQVYLVPISQGNSTVASAAASSNSTSTSPISVNLKVPIFVASTASVEPYCATFDPSPENPAPLTVTPCTNETVSSHESQKFLYNPDTGVIHPDWQPSTDAQQLLQAVPDSVDEADPTQAQAQDVDMSAEAEADPATSAETPAATVARRATPTPSGTVNSPPPLVTSGPQTSTGSTALPQPQPSSGSGASNVTLIFTPVNPAIVNSASVNFDSSFTPAEDDSATQAGMDSQQATMTKRGFHAVNPVNPDINGGSLKAADVNDQAQTASQASSNNFNDFNGMNVEDDSNNGNDVMNSQAQATPVSSSSSMPVDNSSPAGAKGIHADAKANLNLGDSLLQKPMIAPESLTAPYQWRWTKAESVDESALSKAATVV